MIYKIWKNTKKQIVFFFYVFWFRDLVFDISSELRLEVIA